MPVVSTLSQPLVPSQSTASSQLPSSSLLTTTEPDHIKPETLVNYLELLNAAHQYEQRYTTVAAPRKKLLAGPLKAIINRLREETFNTLINELLAFLSGREQIVIGQPVRISNEEGKHIFFQKSSIRFLLAFHRTSAMFIDDCIAHFQSIARQ